MKKDIKQAETLISTDKIQEYFKIEEFKQKNKCTYFEYGDIPIFQESYCCEICDPNKTEMICAECYNQCHKHCRSEEIREESSIIENQKKEKMYFQCECGKKKHEIERKNVKELEKKCLFSEFEINMGRKYRYYCKTCGIDICYNCSIICHRRKNGCFVSKTLIEYYNQNGIIEKKIDLFCGCINPRHSNIISMTQIIGKIIDREEFEDTKFIWKLQLFNNFCTTKIFDDLFNETSELICDFHNDNYFKKNMLNVCDRFVRLGQYVFTSQKYFYFREKYIDKYPYDKLIYAIISFNPKQFEKYGNFICSMCFFFYFLHLKKDFQNIKGLCIIDFFISSPLDRILYRRLIHNRNIYSSQIYDKYFDEEEQRYCLGDICVELFEVLNKAFSDFTIKKLDKCLKNYFTIFKICFFCLKRFVFDFKALNKFVTIFLKISSSIYHFVIERIKNDKNQKEFVNILSTLMDYITKINCALVINYNDLIIEEIIFNKNKKYDEYSYIHYNSETSNNIFKITIITSLIYGIFTLNNVSIDTNYLLMLNNIIEIFILSSNNYGKRLKEIKKNNFDDFFILISKIDKLKEMEDNIVKHTPRENIQYDENNDSNQLNTTLFEPKIIENFNEPQSLEIIIRKNVYNLKENIENLFNKYFHYEQTNENIEKEIIFHLMNFCSNNDMKLVLETDEESSIYNSEKEKLKKTVTFDKEIIEETYDTILQRHEIKKYKEKIEKIISETFPFISSEIFTKKVSNINLLIDELILSSLDTTLTKIFFIDKSNKLLQESNSKIYLDFLLIYCLSKEGLNNFCLGRNFRRLIKTLSLFPKISLNFLKLVFKGIYLYKIDIKHHKKIPKIINDLLQYLENYKIKTINDENEFKKGFIKISKIFIYISKFLEFINIDNIQLKFCKIIKEKKIIESQNLGRLIPLYFIYSKDGHIEREADTNIKMISERFKFIQKGENLAFLNEESKNDNESINERGVNMLESYKAELFAQYIVKEKYALKAKEREKEEKEREKDEKSFSPRKINHSIKLINLPIIKESNNNIKDIKENEMYYLDNLGKVDPKTVTKLNEKFIFSFINFFAETTFYCTKNDTFLTLNELFDLDFLSFLLRRKYLKLKYRIILLSYLKNFYLNDEINPITYSINYDVYPNSEEYFKIIQFTKNEFENKFLLEEMGREKITNKLHKVNSLKTIIEEINNEMSIMIKVIKYDNDQIINGIKYLSQLIFLIQYVGDIIITYDITSHVTLWFYELVKNFEQNNIFLKKFFKNVLENQNIDSIDLDKENLYKNYKESELNSRNFNIYDKEKLYSIFFKLIQNFYDLTSFNKQYNLTKFIELYKTRNDEDFKLFCLNPVVDEYTCLIQTQNDNLKNKKKIKKKKTKVNKKLKAEKDPIEKAYGRFIKGTQLYSKQFNNMSKTSFIQIIFTKSNDISIEYKDIIFEYIILSLYHINEVEDCNLISLFIFINKILFYDFEKGQDYLINNLQKKNKNYVTFLTHKKSFNEELFENNKNLLRKIISLQIVFSRNISHNERFKKLCLLSKNMIQFFQLLGEGHNKVFQSLLVNGTNPQKKNNIKIIKNNDIFNLSKNYPESIFNVLCITLDSSLKMLNIYHEPVNGELPYDKLIILMNNIIDCIVEFFQGTTKTSYIDMYKQVKLCFNSMKTIIQLKLPPSEEKNRRKFIILLKTSILDLISSMIEEGISDDPEISSLKDIMVTFQPMDLYHEIIECFITIHKEFESSFNGIQLDNLNAIYYLKELYKFNSDFQNNIELKLAFKIFYLLKVLTEVYNRIEIIDLFKNFKIKYNHVINQQKEIQKNKKNNDSSNNNLVINNNIVLNNNYLENDNSQNFEENQSNNSSKNKKQNMNLSLFSDNSNNLFKKKQQNQSNEKLNDKLNDKIMNIKKNKTLEQPFIKPQLKQSITVFLKKKLSQKSRNSDFNITNISILNKTKTNYVIYKFLSEIMTRIQIRTENAQSNRDFSFFIVPPLCLLLSQSTKNTFTETVNRETVATKILSLFEESDYFIFEMFYNKMRMENFSKISLKLFNLEIKNLEYINYIFIVVQNIFVVIHYYSKTPIEPKEKNEKFLDNVIISLIHMLFIIFVLSVWFIFKFKLQFKHQIMKKYKERFIFLKAGEKSNEEILEEEELLNKVGSKLTLTQKILLILYNTIIANREVNIFVFSFIFTLIYIYIPNCIFISIPLLFIANVNNILFGIVYSLILRIKQLFFVLIFMYLIVYLFTWFAFYYFSELFEFSNLYNVKTDDTTTEKLCSSMVQCYLTMLSYGVRSGGGIGDVIPMLSYKVAPGYYIAGFFFVVLFHMFVVWIMINLFFGIIVDTFAALREKTYQIEEDKNNTCYICQITRDSALNNNINFDRHVNNIHNIWNYVNFLAYLHINNERNFKSLETFIWGKIPKNDTSWLPIGEEYCQPENENYND